MMKCGIDMGAGASPLLFAIAMDPLLSSLRVIPEIASLSAYVDDLAAGMSGIMGYTIFVKTLDNYRAISGIEVTRHECYKANLAPCNDQLGK
eukprot:1639292-Heterocapsa_arctica.AAC.1